MKAKKLLKKNAVAPTGARPVATQPAEVTTNVMPVAQKKSTKAAKKQLMLVKPVQFVCKKAKKEMKKAAKAAAAQMTFMPIQQVIKKVDDVEAIPQMNESFDYSMTDPLVDEITSYAPDITSSTGISSMKNSMM
jgi:hypothetical protein